ncbi:hypothetical protein AAFC00_000871 [Neodothiora populina]|uniref:Phytanoyl-CoA dioxygenase n=1 Tax=Neodothiora populina TaxID=2781224 RepID=A0ABR3PM17_9PEZI
MSATVTSTVEVQAPRLTSIVPTDLKIGGNVDGTPKATDGEGQTADWLHDFHTQGYAIIKSAITPEQAEEYRSRTWSHLENFPSLSNASSSSPSAAPPAFKISEPETWTANNLPFQSKINTFSSYCIPHERFVWDLRLEPSIIAPFATLWQTPELLVSFDALNVTLPNRRDKPVNSAWPHVDQSPFRSGLICAQGLVNLNTAGPHDGGLVVFPGSHKLVSEFFETQTDKANWSQRDLYLFTESELEWFAERDVKPVKLCADPGDLIIWDSRTIHWGAEPEPEKSDVVRTVVYVSYAPAAAADAATIEARKQCFEKWQATTHWANRNIIGRDGKVVLQESQVEDPRNRSEPVEKPVLGEKGMKLVGLMPY